MADYSTTGYEAQAPLGIYHEIYAVSRIFDSTDMLPLLSWDEIQDA